MNKEVIAIPCPKCLKDVLELVAEGQYQCPSCDAVQYGGDWVYPASEQKYVDWQ